MRFFVAGIMQGSKATKGIHAQDYRQQICQLIRQHFPEAEIYDPLAEHRNSVDYEAAFGREVFFRHNRMCREVDVLVAYLPEASMGTAIEMWEAFQHGAAVISISPLRTNWTVCFLSHAIYDDMEQFARGLQSGEVARVIASVRNRLAENHPGVAPKPEL